MRSILLALPILIAATPALAQDEDQEMWLAAAAGFRLGSGLRLELDTVSRFSADQGGLYEIELNSLLTHEIAKGITIGAGYVRNTNYSRGDVTRTEDRLRAHLGVVRDIGPLTLSGRVRLEYRMRSDGTDTGWRLRPFIKATLPVGGPFSLVASHESFVPLNDTDWRQRAGYERMRNMAGLSIKANRTLTIDAGYINQYNFSRGDGRDILDHALMTGIVLSF